MAEETPVNNEPTRRPLTWQRTTPDVAWKVRHYDAVICKSDGTEVFRLNHVEAPGGMDDMAITVAAQKYLIRRGANTTDGREHSIFDMFHGVAETIAMNGIDQRYFAWQVDAHRFQEDLYYLLVNQSGAFNSPVWFNVRQWHVHGIEGSGGNWAWDRETNGYTVVTNGYKRPQCSACFITSIEDSLVGPRGIGERILTEFRVFKRGSGVGSNFSKLREKNAPLSGGGGSSGLLSFLEVFDRAAGSTKSGGTTRRAAKMVCLDADHPEIEAFIEWKVREEKKARDLIDAGWSGDMEGDAYTTVSGQNANNSVRVNDTFMMAVEADRDWSLTSRVGGGVVKTIKAKKLWRQIAEASWFCADPGVQFDTTINYWHTTPNAGRINASNPCSEYMSIDDSACNLASIRLTKYLREDGTFDIEGFRAACRTFLVAQDILVDLSSYPTAEIAEGAHKFRQLGLGYADLGALLMLLGIPYDSDEGRATAAQITSLMTAQAYLTSTELAEHLGPFEGYEADRDNVLKVLNQHWTASRLPVGYTDGLIHSLAYTIQQVAETVWGQVCTRARQYGVRNAQVTVLAPTGTIGFLMGVTTTGIEPLLAHRQFKQLAGGGNIMILNDIVVPSLRRMGYETEVAESIAAYVADKGYFTGSGIDPKDLPVFDTAFPADKDSRSLRPEAHVLMVAAVQQFITGAVSKTVNMPNTATVEDIEAIHWLAWKTGVKAIAVYRDGCKGSQPVKTKAEEEKGVAREVAKLMNEAPGIGEPRVLDTVVGAFAKAGFSVVPIDPPFKRFQRKLPKQRRGITWALKLDEHKIYIRSGEYEDGSVGEVFIDLAKEGSTLGGLVAMWSKTISLALQYGTPLEELVETFIYTRFEPFGRVLNHPTIRTATSIVDLVMRVLAVHYLKRTDLQHVQPEALTEGVIPPPTHLPAQDIPQISPEASHGFTSASGDGPACPECGSITKRNGTCYRCPNCGASLGCS